MKVIVMVSSQSTKNQNQSNGSYNKNSSKLEVIGELAKYIFDRLLFVKYISI